MVFFIHTDNTGWRVFGKLQRTIELHRVESVVFDVKQILALHQQLTLENVKNNAQKNDSSTSINQRQKKIQKLHSLVFSNNKTFPSPPARHRVMTSEREGLPPVRVDGLRFTMITISRDWTPILRIMSESAADNQHPIRSGFPITGWKRFDLILIVHGYPITKIMRELTNMY